jgi:hypothetical protein
MAPDTYHPLSQEDIESPSKDTQNHGSNYYDNTYDDSSDRDSLLQKDGPSSPGLVERGHVEDRESTAISLTQDVRTWPSYRYIFINRQYYRNG